MNKFHSFKEFYPYYLKEHSHFLNRRLHFIGTLLVILIVCFAISNCYWQILIWAPIAGYSFAWIGHFIIEKNRPATFKHPLYSLMGDFLMFWQMLTGTL